MNFENQIEKIAKDIRDRENKELALVFTNVVGSLLRENGVFVKTSRNEFVTDNETDKDKYIIKKEYGISIDGLDFTEHDKGFNDEITDLRKELRESKNYITQLKHDLEKTYNQLMEVEKDAQERIAELKSELEARDVNNRTVELPFDPLETANMLINATYKDEIPFLERQVDSDIYSIDDLEQIAEHLLVYCKHNKESEE